MTRLAVCIDDFGLRPGVDAAILELAGAGRVSAFSCLAGSPRWPQAARALHALRGQVDIGLHLDFTETPRDAGLRYGLRDVIGRAYLRSLPRQRVADEIRAQWDAFEDAAGQAPDHVDGHQHVHQLPVIRDLLLEEIARRGQSPWLRSTRVPAGEPGLKPRVIAALGDGALRRAAQARGLRTSGHLLGVYGFDGNAASWRAQLVRWLRLARDGDVLMTHPGQDDTSGVADPIASARLRELAVLQSPQWPQLLARQGVTVERLSVVG